MMGDVLTYAEAAIYAALARKAGAGVGLDMDPPHKRLELTCVEI